MRLDLLEQCRQLAASDGDDEREAMCGIEIALRLTRAKRDGDRAPDLAKFPSSVLKSVRDPRLESGIALRQAFALAGLGQPQKAAEFAAHSFQLALGDELRLQMARSALFWLRSRHARIWISQAPPGRCRC